MKKLIFVLLVLFISFGCEKDCDCPDCEFYEWVEQDIEPLGYVISSWDMTTDTTWTYYITDVEEILCAYVVIYNDDHWEFQLDPEYVSWDGKRIWIDSPSYCRDTLYDDIDHPRGRFFITKYILPKD